jgi:hypothetical protein
MRILSLAAVAFYLALTAVTHQALMRAGAPTLAQGASLVAER